MRIIFVGIYNKPNTKPLCKSTKTGKLLNRITEQIKCDTILKTNLYNVEYCPKEWREKQSLAIDWHKRVEPQSDDIIILLGAETHKWFLNTGFTIIKLAHPASKYSHESINNPLK